MVALFESVLEAEGVGLDDSFFELGGDSITAIQLVGRARAADEALARELALAVRVDPLDAGAGEPQPDPVAVAAAEPADEGLVCEQPARMRMVARARVALVVLMRSPG